MLYSVKSQTFHFLKFAGFSNDLKETRFLGEVVVDEVNKAVAVNHVVNNEARR